MPLDWIVIVELISGTKRDHIRQEKNTTEPTKGHIRNLFQKYFVFPRNTCPLPLWLWSVTVAWLVLGLSLKMWNRRNTYEVQKTVK